MVARLVVFHQKQIALRHVFIHATAKSQAGQALGLPVPAVYQRHTGQLAGVADAGVVKNQPRRVGRRLRQQLHQLDHIGIGLAAGEVVVGAVAADNELPGDGMFG